MRFITSISPGRIERQQYCLNSWLPYGTITAVQSAVEIELLAKYFPQVEFVETKLVGGFNNKYPLRVRVKAHIDAGPGLLINSDIKIDTTPKQFNEDWRAVDGQFNIGVRYDFDGPGRPKELNLYGIDAFLITREVMDALPDVGFVIGTPVWDYWIIYQLMMSGFDIKTKLTPGLLHLRHSDRWDKEDHKVGMAKMAELFCGIDKQSLSYAIAEATGRAKMRGFNPS